MTDPKEQSNAGQPLLLLRLRLNAVDGGRHDQPAARVVPGALAGVLGAGDETRP
jgi:hypothetical protein